MSRWIFVRLLAAGPTLLFVAALGFVLMRLAPGGPFDLERPLDPAALASLRRVYGLDAPLWRQFCDYLVALAHGDLGPSFAWRDFTVAQLFARALPVSAGIGAAALAISWPAGIALGLAAARRGGSRFDAGVVAAASLGLTIPSFVLAPLMQLLFGLKLGWLPVGGTGGISHYVMPVATLALPQLAAVTRLTRTATREALAAPSQRTALAYGLPERVRLGRAFKAARLPLISYFGPAVASVLTGSVVVETLFGLPGVGRYFVEAALDRDYTVSLGAALLAAAVVVALNLLSDVAYWVADPRARK